MQVMPVRHSLSLLCLPCAARSHQDKDNNAFRRCFIAAHAPPNGLNSEPGPYCTRYFQGGVQLSEEEISLVVSNFSAVLDRSEDEDGAEEEGGGRGSSDRGDSVDYDAFVRWLSEGLGLDDELLWKVQRHLKARLSK